MEQLQQVRTILIVLEVLGVGGLLFGVYVGVVFLVDAVKRRK